MADQAMKRPITSDSLFNLASLGNVFDATLLALAVRQGELSAYPSMCLLDQDSGSHLRTHSIFVFISAQRGAS
jgi:hypothetical protein